MLVVAMAARSHLFSLTGRGWWAQITLPTSFTRREVPRMAGISPYRIVAAASDGDASTASTDPVRVVADSAGAFGSGAVLLYRNSPPEIMRVQLHHRHTVDEETAAAWVSHRSISCVGDTLAFRDDVSITGVDVVGGGTLLVRYAEGEGNKRDAPAVIRTCVVRFEGGAARVFEATVDGGAALPPHAVAVGWQGASHHRDGGDGGGDGSAGRTVFASQRISDGGDTGGGALVALTSVSADKAAHSVRVTSTRCIPEALPASLPHAVASATAVTDAEVVSAMQAPGDGADSMRQLLMTVDVEARQASWYVSFL